MHIIHIDLSCPYRKIIIENKSSQAPLFRGFLFWIIQLLNLGLTTLLDVDPNLMEIPKLILKL